MEQGQLVTIGVIALGAAVMLVAVAETRRLFGSLDGPYRERWRLLSGLMAVFVASYVGAIGIVLGGYRQVFAILASGVFLLGAAFVLLVVRTGRETISDMRRTRTHLENVLGSMSEALFIASTDGTIQRVNERLCAVLGRDESDLVGRHADEVFVDGGPIEWDGPPKNGPTTTERTVSERTTSAKRPGSGRTGGERTDEKSGKGGESGWEVVNEETTLVTADGGHVPVLLSASVVERADDRPTEVVCTARDVTAQQRRQQQLKVQNRLLRHNVRNDLNVVEGYADAIESGSTDPVVRSHAAVIGSVADRMVSRSEKLRAATAVVEAEAGKDGKIDLAALIEGRVATARETYPDVRFVVDGPQSAWVEAGPAIEIAIDELLANAVEHSGDPAPVVEVSVSAPTATDASHERVRVSVADGGPGVPRHEREPITNGDETPLRHGSGVGLWTVKWVVERAGGEIDFYTGADSAVVVSLPRTTEPAESAATAEPSVGVP